MNAAQHNVWPYKVSREDNALEFVSFMYDEGVPGLSARVRIGDEEVHMTTSRDLDPEERDELISSIRSHFASASFESAFETVSAASQLPGCDRTHPELTDISSNYLSPDDKSSLLKWELGSHSLPAFPETPGSVIVLQEQHFVRDCGEFFDQLEYREQRELLRVVDTARLLYEREAETLLQFETGSVDSTQFEEAVRDIQVGLYDYELLMDNFSYEQSENNPILAKHISRVLENTLEQLEDGLAVVNSHAPDVDPAPDSADKLLLNPTSLGMEPLNPEEFLSELSEEMRDGFNAILTHPGSVDPMEVFPKRYTDAYFKACQYLSLHPATGAAGTALVARSGEAGELFLQDLWKGLPGKNEAERGLQRSIAAALGEFGNHNSIAFLAKESEITTQGLTRPEARAIATLRKNAAYLGLQNAGERAQGAYEALKDRYLKAPSIADLGLLKALIAIDPEQTLEHFRENLHNSLHRGGTAQATLILNHFRDHGVPSDLQQLLSVFPTSPTQEQALDTASRAIIKREPSLLKRMSYHLDRYMNRRVSSMAREAGI